MCVVRIALIKGKSSAYLSAVSDAINDALIQAYEMEDGDLFQIIQQLNDNELLFAKNYRGGPRSNDFMLLNILGPEKTIPVKQAFFKRVVALLNERAGVRPEDVFISLQSTGTADWSFSNGSSLVPEALIT